jgi:hypothetical protein
MNTERSTAEQIQDIADLLIFAKKPFTLTITNYTAKIESDFYPHKCIDELKSARFFVGCRMVENDCKKMPVPDVEKKFLKYNDFNINGPIYLEEIYGVDIVSAYPSILHRDKYISKKTFSYIKKLPKLDRLGSIGFLAAKKNVFKYNAAGKITEYKENRKETENYFYYAVQKTAEIMDQARKVIKGEYFFTWVDCVYMKDKEDAENVVKFFAENNLKAKLKKYEAFNVIEKKNGKLICTFIDEEQDLKTFFIPSPKEKIRNAVTNYLLNKQKNKHE